MANIFQSEMDMGDPEGKPKNGDTNEKGQIYLGGTWRDPGYKTKGGDIWLGKEKGWRDEYEKNLAVERTKMSKAVDPILDAWTKPPKRRRGDTSGEEMESKRGDWKSDSTKMAAGLNPKYAKDLKEYWSQNPEYVKLGDFDALHKHIFSQGMSIPEAEEKWRTEWMAANKGKSYDEAPPPPWKVGVEIGGGLAPDMDKEPGKHYRDNSSGGDDMEPGGPRMPRGIFGKQPEEDMPIEGPREKPIAKSGVQATIREMRNGKPVGKPKPLKMTDISEEEFNSEPNMPIKMKPITVTPQSPIDKINSPDYRKKVKKLLNTPTK